MVLCKLCIAFSSSCTFIPTVRVLTTSSANAVRGRFKSKYRPLVVGVATNSKSEPHQPFFNISILARHLVLTMMTSPISPTQTSKIIRTSKMPKPHQQNEPKPHIQLANLVLSHRSLNLLVQSYIKSRLKPSREY